jgi:hypothetical protein
MMEKPADILNAIWEIPTTEKDGMIVPERIYRNIIQPISVVGLAEEAGFAFENTSGVDETTDITGILRKVVELKPIGNIKKADLS